METPIYNPKELQWFPHDRPDLAPSIELRNRWCDPCNPDNPFSKYIGNEKAVKRLNRAAFAAFGKYNRCCSDVSFAILGPASTGKTTVAKMFAELVGIPFAEISPRSVLTVNDIAQAMAKVLEETIVDGETLQLEDLGNGFFKFPPMIVFIDEVHALRKNIVQGLLKATEKKDSILVTENDWTFDCSNICWLIATTDRGSLFDAFDTRFSKIHLRLYSLKEVAKIIKINNPDWDDEICDLVAKFGGRVPREALAFAAEMRLEYEMSHDDWEEIASRVAEENDIDPYGMSYQRLEILKALGQQPIARARLCDYANCKEEELVRFVLPPLLCATPDQDPLIRVSSKGYCITEEGLKELDKRGIFHAGVKALGKKL